MKNIITFIFILAATTIFAQDAKKIVEKNKAAMEANNQEATLT
jgi:hypothetical protein